jgi:hypothetical protein
MGNEMPILRKVLREPLLHFVILGAALFVVFNWMDDTAGAGDNRIVVTPGRVEHLVAGFERTCQRLTRKQPLSTGHALRAGDRYRLGS